MNITEIKPIRPTTVVFERKIDAESFHEYASNKIKTNSVGMTRMREMMDAFSEKRI